MRRVRSLRLRIRLNLDRGTVELVVRAKPAYGSQERTSSDISLSTGWRVVYDAERDFVFGSRGFSFSPPNSTLDSVMKFALDPTGVTPPAFTFKQFPSLNDIALSPDGRTLYVLTATQLHFADPVTLSTTFARRSQRRPASAGPGGWRWSMTVAS